MVLIEPGSIDTPIWKSGQEDADDLLDRAAPGMRELYGATIERYRKVVQDTAERGIPAEKVAAKIEHALEAKRPRFALPDRHRRAGDGTAEAGGADAGLRLGDRPGDGLPEATGADS